MDEHPDMRPEGKIIKAALDRRGMTAAEAARLAGLSAGRWHQIVNGRQNVSKGTRAAVIGPAARVARMARVVGVTAEQMDEAGRPDVAALMRGDDSQYPSAGSGPGEDDAVVLVLSEALQAFERKVLASPRLSAEQKLNLIELHRKTGGDKLLDSYRGRLGRRSNG